jgi:phosphatidylglycerol lysyltransferase
VRATTSTASGTDASAPATPYPDGVQTSTDLSPAADRARVLALLRRHGWNATSFQILETGFRYWFDGDDACIGYVDTGRAWVAAAPVAAADRFEAVMAGFVAAATAAGRRVCCFGTEQRFVEATHWRALRIGDQPVWRPAEWDTILAGSRSLREQLRRGRAKGVTVRAVTPGELEPGHPIRSQLDALIVRWLASRTIAPMGFLVQVEPFSFVAERQYFAALLGDRVVGFLGVIPIYARRGWFYEDFLRDPAAPNGTVELLVDAGMRAAIAAGIEHVTFGLVPLAGDVGPWLRAARRWGRTLYDFDGLRAFKAKFRPGAWDPIFLSYPPQRSGVLALVDTLTAFARGGLLRFGIETVLRGPAIVVRLLAVLLVVWTAVLALPASARWFPSSAWQYGWVAFDVALAGALTILSFRWHRRLADLVATAVTADAVLTLGQAILYNVPRRDGPYDLVVIVIAVLAPTMAAVLLWNARAHRATG